jgi:hypothetical protein
LQRGHCKTQFNALVMKVSHAGPLFSTADDAKEFGIEERIGAKP